MNKQTCPKFCVCTSFHLACTNQKETSCQQSVSIIVIWICLIPVTIQFRTSVAMVLRTGPETTRTEKSANEIPPKVGPASDSSPNEEQIPTAATSIVDLETGDPVSEGIVRTSDAKAQTGPDDGYSSITKQTQAEQSPESSQNPPSGTSCQGEFFGLTLPEKLQHLCEQESSSGNRKLMEHIESSLNASEIEKFVCLGGLCHAYNLLSHADEDIQVTGWKVLLAAHLHMPQCHSSLVDLGLYRRILQSLQACGTSNLFETLVQVLVSPILGTDTYIQDFVSLDGAVPSVIMAIDRQLGTCTSYISCCRFLANVLASRQGEGETATDPKESQDV